MRIAALTAGAGADRVAFSGAIHSLFTRACNIERADGRLLGLVAREVGAVPRGFQLATPSSFDFRDYLRVNTSVSCRAGLSRFERSALVIDLRPASSWRSDLGKFPIASDDSAIAAAWRAAWAVLVEHGGADELAGQADGAIDSLLHAAQARRPKVAFAAISRLIGFGPGLTPAGDDFLVGFLAALRSTAGNDEPLRAFRAGVAAFVASVAAQTNLISRTYLEAACEGEVSEPLAALAAAIGQADAREALRAAKSALSVGASSGAAASYGFLAGIRALTVEFQLTRANSR
jgi:Protein of unknown function (DUF2877)